MVKTHGCNLIAVLFFYIGIFAFPVKSYSQDPKTYWQHYKEAQELTKQKNYQQALEILLRLKDEQENFNIDILIAEIYSDRNDPKQALFYYKKAYQLLKDTAPTSYKKLVLFGIARTELAQRNGREALNYYNLLLTYDLSKEELALVKTNLETSKEVLKKQELQEAIEKIRIYIEKGKGYEANQLVKPLLVHHTATIYLLAGNSYALMDKPKEALDYLKQALEYAKSENNLSLQKIILFSLARVELAANNVKQAEATYKQLLKESDKEDKKIASEGLKQVEEAKQKNITKEKLDEIASLIEKGNGKKAMQLLTPILATNKTSRIYLYTAQSKALLNEFPSALNYYQLAYTSAQKEKSETLARIALFGMARTQLSLNQPVRAQKTYLSILQGKLTPKDRQLAQNGLDKANEQILLKTFNGYIDSNQGQKAYALILPYFKKYNKTKYYTLLATSMLSLNQPLRALYFYKEAYRVAFLNKNSEQQIVALKEIASTQMELDFYVRASQTYRTLLTYSLNPKEYELAKAGLIKSLAYRGRTYKAYDEIPWTMKFTSPHMVIAAIQTALWLHQGDRAKELYVRYTSILNEIKPGTHLYSDLKNIEWLLCLETAPYQIRPDTYYFKDSDDFIIQRDKVNARRYWSQYWQSNLAVSYLNYSQFGQRIEGYSVLFNQIWQPSRFWIFTGEIAPTQLDNWNPLLFNITGNYSPNDYISFNASTNKELVEGFSALSNHISFDSYLIGVTLQPFAYLSLYGTAYQLDFTDNNRRNGYNFITRASIVAPMGIYTGFRLRNFDNAFQSPFYFSPNFYRERTFFSGISRRIAVSWRYFAEGGYGDQTIQPQAILEATTAPTWYYKLGLRGPLTPCIYFDFSYGNYNQAAAFTNTAGYRYQEILGSLAFSFD